MGSSESTKKLTVERSEEEGSPGIVKVSERVVRRLRGQIDLPLQGDEEIGQDDINNIWHDLQQERARLKHQQEHLQEFMQNAYDEGRQVEAKRLKENRGTLGDKDAQGMENQWRKTLEEKDAESRTKESKLLEQINVLKKNIALKEKLTVEKFNQAVEDTKQKFSLPTKVPACQHLKNELLNCYKQNPSQALKCSQQVRDFINCVELSQVDSQEPKK
ncbi:hypothetical protein OS493_016606 [Desmophyllum pertusum]|uniref:MICOS complex subunit MIC19 n=1 Tax=Desmophyllum pertusum TaxID=174260 RepID=A0A9W9ZDE6_9CNID|nr:hypothetical protein OS493_016606 [Desmophyllum pertusum]